VLVISDTLGMGLLNFERKVCTILRRSDVPTGGNERSPGGLDRVGKYVSFRYLRRETIRIFC